MLRSIRLSCDRQLRRELGFSLDAAQSWASFPQRWLDHASCVVRRMVAEAHKMAGLSGIAKAVDGSDATPSSLMEQVELEEHLRRRRVN